MTELTTLAQLVCVNTLSSRSFLSGSNGGSCLVGLPPMVMGDGSGSCFGAASTGREAANVDERELLFSGTGADGTAGGR
jgi:hypothetical protein